MGRINYEGDSLHSASKPGLVACLFVDDNHAAQLSNGFFCTHINPTPTPLSVFFRPNTLQEKQAAIQAGQHDVVLDNAGPSAAILPPGWLADPLMPLPLHIDQINHRRCMVVFNEPKAKGWFFGTVSGISRRKGYNYSVKFDKSETASIEIDGIKSVIFSDSGEFAYGKGWVLCHRDPDYVGGPGETFGSRPATTATTGSDAADRSRPGTQGMVSRPGTQGATGL